MISAARTRALSHMPVICLAIALAIGVRATVHGGSFRHSDEPLQQLTKRLTPWYELCQLDPSAGQWVGRFCNACEVLPAGVVGSSGWFDLCWSYRQPRTRGTSFPPSWTTATSAGLDTACIPADMYTNGYWDAEAYLPSWPGTSITHAGRCPDDHACVQVVLDGNSADIVCSPVAVRPNDAASRARASAAASVALDSAATSVADVTELDWRTLRRPIGCVFRPISELDWREITQGIDSSSSDSGHSDSDRLYTDSSDDDDEGSGSGGVLRLLPLRACRPALHPHSRRPQ